MILSREKIRTKKKGGGRLEPIEALTQIKELEISSWEEIPGQEGMDLLRRQNYVLHGIKIWLAKKRCEEEEIMAAEGMIF